MSGLTGEAAFSDVVVVGAGVVGMACALALQRAGRRVTVADPRPPGSGCSWGNAGVIAADHVLPLSRPEVLLRVPRMLSSRDAPLYLKASRVPGLLPWFVRFGAACAAARVARGIEATAALTGRSVAAWQRALAGTGAEALLQARGLYTVYRREAAFEADGGERETARRLGVAWEVLSGDEARRRQPALGPAVTRAVYFPGVAHVLDPAGLVARLAAAFERDGGRLVAAPVTGLDTAPHQVTVALDGGRLRCRYVVVAAGIDAAALCAPLGWRPPLVAELGYHLTFAGGIDGLTAPVAAAESGFIATPMAMGLRLAGTVEFARRPAPPAWHRAEALRRQALGLLRAPLPEAAGRWQGARPTLPDYLPAIGALPGQPRVLAAFGHQHIGLTTAAITGEIVRDLVDGVPPAVDPRPYAPGRFAASTRFRPAALAR